MTGIGAQANAGDIEVIGTATQLAEIEFDGALTNASKTGHITARHAVMRFNGGLTRAKWESLSENQTYTAISIIRSGPALR